PAVDQRELAVPGLAATGLAAVVLGALLGCRGTAQRCRDPGCGAGLQQVAAGQAFSVQVVLVFLAHDGPLVVSESGCCSGWCSPAEWNDATPLSVSTPCYFQR